MRQEVLDRIGSCLDRQLVNYSLYPIPYVFNPGDHYRYQASKWEYIRIMLEYVEVLLEFNEMEYEARSIN